jgi:hypothetical protein
MTPGSDSMTCHLQNELPFTSSTAVCTERASCTDGTGHRIDDSCCAGIILRIVPRTVPRGRRAKVHAVTGRSGQKPPQRRRDCPWSDSTVDQVVAPPDRAVLGSSGAAAGTGPEAA